MGVTTAVPTRGTTAERPDRTFSGRALLLLISEETTVYNVMFLPIWGEVFFVFDAAQVVSSERCRLLHGGSCFVAVVGVGEHGRPRSNQPSQPSFFFFADRMLPVLFFKTSMAGQGRLGMYFDSLAVHVVNVFEVSAWRGRTERWQGLRYRNIPP